MKHKISIVLLAAIGILLAMVSFASAALPGGATITNNATRIGYLAPTAGSTQVTSGNITAANLDTNQSTFRWAGLMGNVTGQIVLGDSANYMMFNWTAKGNLVYASNGASITWGSLVDANAAAIEGDYTWLVSAAGTHDDYVDTFTGLSESIGSNIFTINSDYATTLSTGVSVWKTYSLDDGDATDVFAGKVVEDGTPYNGNGATDFQMIIPEDGTGGNVNPTSWYLWVELQ